MCKYYVLTIENTRFTKCCRKAPSFSCENLNTNFQYYGHLEGNQILDVKK